MRPSIGWLAERRGTSGPGALVMLSLLVLVLSACANASIPELPPVPTTVAAVPTTSGADNGGVHLEAVAGNTTSTSVALGPGSSGLRGVVQSPGGPVAGAVVQVQRETAPGVAPATDRILTAADGS
jgi:hypothetical protein